MSRSLARPVLSALAVLPMLAGTVLAGTVLVATPALASTALTGPGGFGVAPGPGPNGVAPGYFMLSVAPGRSVRDTVVITNLSRATQRLRITVSKGVTAANAGSAYEPLTGRCAGAACWISGLPGVITVAGGARQALSFTVTVPARARSAQYLAGISAEKATRPRAVRVGRHGHSSARAIIVDEVTVGVAVTVGPLAAMRTAVAIRGVSATWIGSLARLNVAVRNTGQTFAKAAGRMTCQAPGRTRTYPVVMDTVLPGTGALLAVNGLGLTSGRVPCRITMRDSAGRRVRWSGLVSLPAHRATREYHTAKGVYVALPQNTIPPWAVALLVLGALILGCLALMLGARHRRATRSGRRAAVGRRA